MSRSIKSEKSLAIIHEEERTKKSDKAEKNFEKEIFIIKMIKDMKPKMLGMSLNQLS